MQNNKLAGFCHTIIFISNESTIQEVPNLKMTLKTFLSNLLAEFEILNLVTILEYHFPNSSQL